MKMKVLIIASILVMHFRAGAQHISVEDKVAQVHEKFTGLLKNDKNKMGEVDNIFTAYYTDQQKLRDDIQKPASTPGMVLGLSPNKDYQSIRKQNDDLATKRDEKLKKLLSADEYKKWKEELEPTLRKGTAKK